MTSAAIMGTPLRRERAVRVPERGRGRFQRRQGMRIAVWRGMRRAAKRARTSSSPSCGIHLPGTLGDGPERVASERVRSICSAYCQRYIWMRYV